MNIKNTPIDKLLRRGLIIKRLEGSFSSEYLTLLSFCSFIVFLGYFELVFFIPIAGLFALSWAVYTWNKKRQYGVSLRGSGVGYQDEDFDLLIPWRNLKLENPCSIDKHGRFCLRLISTQPGVGYVVKRARYLVSDSSDKPSSFELKGSDFVLNIAIRMKEEDLKLLVERCREYVAEKVEKALNEDVSVGCVDFGQSAINRRIVAIRKGVSIKYPTFCPVTGRDCDRVVKLKSLNSHSVIPWFLSKSGEGRVSIFSYMRYLGLLLPLFMHVIVGYYVFFVGMSPEWSREDVFSSFITGSCLFLIIPLVWYVCRDRVRIYDNDDEMYLIEFDDDEYLHAFVDLNI